MAANMVFDINYGQLIKYTGNDACVVNRKLEEVHFADGGEELKSIGMRAFSGCRSLKVFDMPENVVSIDLSCVWRMF